MPGGDTVQVLQTANHLIKTGAHVSVFLTNEKIDYPSFDLFHFFNITRPADILFHLPRLKKPFLVTPILIDYSEYDRCYRKGIQGFILRNLSANYTEYIKTMGRWVTRKDSLKSKAYIVKGQRKTVREILEKAAILLPNSEAEYKRLEGEYGITKKYVIVPNGIDTTLFVPDENITKDDTLVVCAARIEGIKNQLNLIRALNNSKYTLLLIGSAAPNQKNYYNACRQAAAKNVVFYNHISQQELTGYYKRAKVHALPSWFETCGLSSLEAAAMGCNITITEKGYTREYFGNHAFYCDPGDPSSIYSGIEAAAKSNTDRDLQEKIFHEYTWQRAATATLDAYKQIIPL